MRVGQAKVRAAAVAAAALVAAWTYPLCIRGITLGDEGYLLAQSMALLDGKVLYRDLDLFITPGVWILIAGLFKAFGPSVFITRLAAGFCILATTAVGAWIARRLAGPLAAWIFVGGMATVMVWAFPAWTICFYSPWSVLFALCSFAAALAWSRSTRSSWLLLAGLAVATSIAFKQNYGVFALASTAFTIAMMVEPSSSGLVARSRATLLPLMWVGCGVSAILLPLAAYLASQGALHSAWESLLLRPFGGFVQQHSIRYPSFSELWQLSQVQQDGLTYLSPALAQTALRLLVPLWVSAQILRMHVALYWLPPLLLAGGALIALPFRRGSTTDRALLCLVVFSTAVFLGVFPRSDWNHLVNVYQPILVVLAVMLARARTALQSRSTALRSRFAVAALAVGAAYGAVALYWHWEIWESQWSLLESPRAGVRVDPITALMLDHEVEKIRSMTQPNEPVLALPGLSMLPFLAERQMATHYYNFYAVHVGEDKGKEAAAEAEAERVNLVVASYDNFFSDPIPIRTYAPILVDYINRNFREAFSVDQDRHMFLVRRDRPLEEKVALPLPPSCHGQSGPREHLLGASLVQFLSDPVRTTAPAITTCAFRVPSSGSMDFRLAVRRRGIAKPGTAVLVDAWILPAVGETLAPERLLNIAIPIRDPKSWASAPAKEYEIPLTRWIGQRVLLVLRSRIEGEFTTAPFEADVEVQWRGLRVESPVVRQLKLGPVFQGTQDDWWDPQTDLDASADDRNPPYGIGTR